MSYIDLPPQAKLIIKMLKLQSPAAEVRKYPSSGDQYNVHVLQSFIMRSHHLPSKDAPHSGRGVQLLTSFSAFWFNPHCSVCGPWPCVTDLFSALCMKAELPRAGFLCNMLCEHVNATLGNPI